MSDITEREFQLLRRWFAMAEEFGCLDIRHKGAGPRCIAEDQCDTRAILEAAAESWLQSLALDRAQVEADRQMWTEAADRQCPPVGAPDEEDWRWIV